MQTVIKLLGIIALIWIGFTVLGALLGVALKLLLWVLVIGALLLLAATAYAAVKGKPDRKPLRR